MSFAHLGVSHIVQYFTNRTKATLIQPILTALGWDLEDLEVVRREFRRRSRDQPVDYALLLMGTPCLFVEAKSLGKSLDDTKWSNQIITYATVSGVEWVALTDGDEWRIFNSHALVPVEKKLFRSIRISDDSDFAEQTLSLLAKSEMEEKQISRM